MKIGARVLGLWLDTSFGRHITSSGPNVVSRPQAPWLRQLLRFHDFIGFISSFSQENEVMFVKIGARVLDLWLDTSSGPKWPKCTFQVPGPKFKKFFEISWFYWIHLIILEKMRSCLWKFKPGFWTYGWILLLGPSGPNKCAVFRLQVPRSR